ncbi:SusC/RagA family TonB-linked outer membrane protein [Rapidithrix thailandica]|uniref:SusC/RagA family TonB-linked outer membrane protein n=1 Tax=Rapidithrix thailandica TaxID=413964 RepID=A0AAW9S5P3_9BACT
MKTNLPRQLLLMSKYLLYGIILQVFLANMLIAKTVTAQNKSWNEIIVSLNVENESLAKVFSRLENKTGLKFAYEHGRVNLNALVSTSAHNNTLAELLTDISRNTGLKFKRVNNSIFVNKRGNATVPVIEEVVEERIITGSVKDEKGQPLPGVNIVVKGTSNGTITDMDGKFKLSVPENASIVFSSVGYLPKEVALGESTSLQIQLMPDVQTLNEVVVTALGIVKEKKRIGYAVQEIGGESLQKSKAPNVMEALTGKAAGVTVANTNEFFGDPKIFVRGKTPLIVVDGVPVSTDLWNISSDDIENITVLKGPTAAALYGAAGKDGAIQITMKKGAGKENKTTFDFNSNTTFQTSFIRIARAQTQYGPGSGGKYAYKDGRGGGINDSDYSIWGPKFDPNVLIPQYDSPIDSETGERIPTPWVSRGEDNLGNFLQTGMVSTNNITITNSGKHGSFVFSDTYKRQKGVIPNSKLDINTLRLTGMLNLTDKLSLESSLQYNYQHTPNIPRSNYGPHSPIYLMSIWGGAHWDIRDMRDYWVEGKEGIEQKFVESWRYNNPYFLAYEWQKAYTRHSIIAYGKINYKFNDKWSVFFRSHINTHNTIREEKMPVSAYGYSAPDRGGRYNQQHYTTTVLNNDFLINFEDKFLGDQLEVKASLGGNMKIQNYKYSSASTSKLVVPGVYKLSNSTEKVVPYSSLEKFGVYSGYAYVDLGYKNMLFLSLTGRIDKSSTLPKQNDTFFYPSASLSTMVSNMVQLPEAVTYLKVRGAYANVGGDRLGNDIYFTSNAYSTGELYRNTPYASSNSDLIDPNIKPSFSSSYDVGLELGLLNNRLEFDVTYYTMIDGPQIYKKYFSTSTGYNSIIQNGRKTKRYGLELTLKAKPIVKEDFSWSILANYDRSREVLHELPNGETKEGRRNIGDRVDDYWYYQWQKTPEGDLIIGGNGLPVRTKYKYLAGYYKPDWSFSVSNTFHYKNFALSFLFDGRIGGFLFDVIERDLWRSGSHPDAIHPERELGNQGEKAVLVEGKVVVSGEATYDDEGNLLSDTREYADNETMVYYQSWAKNYKADWPSVGVSKTFVKLRELTLTYTLPQSVLGKTFINSAQVSFVARNLWYWTKDDTFLDLDTFTMGGRSSSPDEGELQLPSMRTFGFNVNLKF